jgi:hypothetical protein
VNVYPFIEAERAQQRTVKRACQLLQVSRAAYYAHRTANVAARHRVDEELTEHIRAATRRPRAATAPHAFTPTCAAAATGTAASVWPG